MAFLNSRRGFACDDIISYEVVLADGSIVKADKTNHARLFRALKGGSNNFGIVTNFKMNMLSNNKIWGGLTISSKEFIPNSIDAMHEFTTKIKDSPDETVWTLFMHSPELKDTVIATARECYFRGDSVMDIGNVLTFLTGRCEHGGNGKGASLREILAHSDYQYPTRH